MFEQIQIIDLESAAYFPKVKCVKGMLAGNDNWRISEKHFKVELNKPTDNFSFGAVCIYLILRRVIFGLDNDLEKHQANGALPALIRLQRRFSYFGDHKGVDGLLKYIADDDTSCQILRMLWEERSEEQIPYEQFSQCPDAGNAALKNIIRGLTGLEPKRRI